MGSGQGLAAGARYANARSRSLNGHLRCLWEGGRRAAAERAPRAAYSARLKTASDSKWCVCGKMSNARSSSRS